MILSYLILENVGSESFRYWDIQFLFEADIFLIFPVVVATNIWKFIKMKRIISKHNKFINSIVLLFNL